MWEENGGKVGLYVYHPFCQTVWVVALFESRTVLYSLLTFSIVLPILFMTKPSFKCAEICCQVNYAWPRVISLFMGQACLVRLHALLLWVLFSPINRALMAFKNTDKTVLHAHGLQHQNPMPCHPRNKTHTHTPKHPQSWVARACQQYFSASVPQRDWSLLELLFTIGSCWKYVSKIIY